jgi:O-antigen/teichoic acid export membrane protein
MQNVLLPRAARAFGVGGPREVFRVVWSTTVLVALVMTGFALAVFFCGEIAVTWIYGPGYAGHRNIIGLMGLIMLARALGMTAYNGLWALKHPEVNLWVNGLALLTTIVAALGLMPLWGVFGVTCGLLAGDTIAATTRWGMFLVFVRESIPARELRELPASVHNHASRTN